MKQIKTQILNLKKPKIQISIKYLTINFKKTKNENIPSNVTSNKLLGIGSKKSSLEVSKLLDASFNQKT